jgi:hypothetical protein
LVLLDLEIMKSEKRCASCGRPNSLSLDAVSSKWLEIVDGYSGDHRKGQIQESDGQCEIQVQVPVFQGIKDDGLISGGAFVLLLL